MVCGRWLLRGAVERIRIIRISESDLQMRKAATGSACYSGKVKAAKVILKMEVFAVFPCLKHREKIESKCRIMAAARPDEICAARRR